MKIWFIGRPTRNSVCFRQTNEMHFCQLTKLNLLFLHTSTKHNSGQLKTSVGTFNRGWFVNMLSMESQRMSGKLKSPEIVTLWCPRSRACLQEIPPRIWIFGKMSGKHEIDAVQQDIKTREIRNLFRECHREIGRIFQISGSKMPGEAHVYFTAFSSGRKALVMFCVK